MCEIIGIIFKERAFSVGADKRVPVQVSPVAVFAYAHVAHGCASTVVHNGYCKGLCAVFCGNDSTATVCLLYEWRIAVNDKPRSAV